MKSAHPNVYDDLAAAVRSLVEDTAKAASPPVERWKVVQSNPLVIESIADDFMLEEGDPDVEIDRALLTDRPDVGDTVRVHSDGEDYIIGGVIQ